MIKLKLILLKGYWIANISKTNKNRLCISSLNVGRKKYLSKCTKLKIETLNYPKRDGNWVVNIFSRNLIVASKKVFLSFDSESFLQ